MSQLEDRPRRDWRAEHSSMPRNEGGRREELVKALSRRGLLGHERRQTGWCFTALDRSD